MADIDFVGSNQEHPQAPYPNAADLDQHDLDQHDRPIQHQEAQQSEQLLGQVQDELLDPRLLVEADVMEADEEEFYQGIGNPHAQATAQPQAAPVADRSLALPLTEFHRFIDLPREIQVMIFTEAIRKPNIHRIQAKRTPTKANGSWSLSFHPVPKGKDNSGYRRAIDIATVNRVAYAAVRLATQHHQARLPFKSLRARIDGAQDLVLIEIPDRKGDTLPYFHPAHQFLNPPGSTFDSDSVAAQFAGIERIALRFREIGHKAHFWKCNFRCVGAQHPPHRDHDDWPMCPEGVCGLLNCFPDLREFYLILDYSHNSNYQITRAKVYTRNYHSVPATHPARLPLTTFHTATGLSYIELDPAFAFDVWETKVTTTNKDNTTTTATTSACDNATTITTTTANNPPPPTMEVRTGPCTIAYTEITYALLAELLDPSTGCFFLDASPHRTAAERAQFRTMYRLPLARRRALKARVLIAVPEEEQVGWEGAVTGWKREGVRTHLGRGN